MSHDLTCPNRPLPLHSQLKLTRRTSTFKATPLGYHPYPSRDGERREDGLASLLAEDLRLLEPDSDEQTRGVSFCKGDVSAIALTPSGKGQNGNQNGVESPLPSSHSGDREAQNGVEFGQNGMESGGEGVESQALVVQQTVGLDATDQRAVLNQVERFDRLMKVLNLLKSAGQMEELESSGVGGMADLKEHIRLALDEAVQLRRETAAMHTKIGVRGAKSGVG